MVWMSQVTDFKIIENGMSNVPITRSIMGDELMSRQRLTELLN